MRLRKSCTNFSPKVTFTPVRPHGLILCLLPQERWKATVLRWLQRSKQASRSELLYHSTHWRSDWQKLKVLESFLNSISRLRTSRSESTHLIFPKLHLLQHLVILNISSFPLVSRTLPRHFRLWWNHSWGTNTSFLFTSMTYWSSARTKKNSLNTFDKSWQSWKDNKLHARLPKCKFYQKSAEFLSHSSLSTAFNLTQTSPLLSRAGSLRKTWRRCSHSWDLCTSTDDSSPIGSNCFTFDKVIDKRRCFWLET